MPLDESQVSTTALEQPGRYQLLGKLGQGGMGTVYLAHDTRLDRRVAVKVLPPESVHNPDAVARFQREAKALAKLSHPGIVQAFDSEEDNGRHFLVMEDVEGQSLLDVLKRDGRIAPTFAADYIHQAAAALQHAPDEVLVPLDPKDRKLEKLELLSQEPSNVDFVRPAPGSPLTQDGAGKIDPSLPRYVGAVPPKGVEPWDWDRTWRARPAAKE